jgi:transposase
VLLDAEDAPVPAVLVLALRALVQQIDALRMAIAALETQILAVAKADPVMRRLAGIPGVGAITAHAIVGAIGDGAQFRSVRDFAACVGLTPKEHASAGKRRQHGISRQGDSRLRTLFALGASTLMRFALSCPDHASEWQRGVLGAASWGGGR